MAARKAMKTRNAVSLLLAGVVLAMVGEITDQNLGVGVHALAGKGKKKQTGNSVLGNMFRAAGIAAGLGATGAMGEAGGVHPLYAQTQKELTDLLATPCPEQQGAPGAFAACPMEARFRAWAFEHKKPYVEADKSGGLTTGGKPAVGLESEYADRFGAFAANVKSANRFNAESGGEAVFGITKFMDMPEAEFMARRGGMEVDAETIEGFEKLAPFYSADTKKPVRNEKNSEFLGKVKVGGARDWSDEGYTTDIKDQGDCGSCWAFSTTEQVESMAIISGITDPDSGEAYVLGPQELVSCDHDGDEGCNGGLPTNALGWLETHSLERETDYPYMSGITGHTGRCKMDKSEGVMEVTSFKRVSHGAEEEDSLTDYLLHEGPLSVGVDANSKWQTYIGGVLKASDCDGPLDHAVQAVGIDTEAYKPYIKVRNSWGEDWGEDGFIRLAAGTNTCGIADMAVTAEVQEVSRKSPATFPFTADAASVTAVERGDDMMPLQSVISATGSASINV